MLCVLYVELIRGVPLITLLFMASVMFPLFMPAGLNVDKLLRAQIAVILFAAAYLAEVVRGGLQALPKGQYEAADALGLSYWKKTGLIILPQALRLVIPPLVNTFIGFFKDTSLVLIIGIFDLLTSGKVALSDPAWQSFSTEVYLVLAAIYFVFCFAMARYSRGLEREFSRSSALTGDKPMSQTARSAILEAVADTPNQPAIVLDKVNKWYGALHVLRDITDGRPEGARRRLRAVRLRQVDHDPLHQPAGGASGRQIFVDGTELTDDMRALDTIRREVGMVFQSFNLFPHLTMLENCTLAPIWVRKMPKAEAEELAMAYLPGEDPGAGEEISGPALRRAAAAGRDRPRAVHAAEDHAVRRADLGARPGDDQGGAGHHDRPGRGRHDDGVRDARDGLRPPGGASGRVHGPRRDRRERAPAAMFEHPQTDRLKLFLSQILRGH